MIFLKLVEYIIYPVLALSTSLFVGAKVGVFFAKICHWNYKKIAT